MFCVSETSAIAPDLRTGAVAYFPQSDVLALHAQIFSACLSQQGSWMGMIFGPRIISLPHLEYKFMPYK